MKKILYISDVNSSEPIFHSQVLPHIEELKKSYNVILMGMDRGDGYAYDYSFSSIRGDYIIPLAYYNFCKQKKQIEEFLLNICVDAIYSRGFRGGLLGGFIKKVIYKKDVKLINDVRADVLDEYQINENVFKKILYRNLVKNVFRQSDVLFFVSSYLRSKYCSKFKYNRQTEVCPTFVPDNKFDFSEINRRLYREKLGYSDNDIVLLYSGNLARWQNVELILEMFGRIDNVEGKIKLLLLTKDDNIYPLVANNKNRAQITVLSVNYTDIQNYYFASDYGLLIRDQNETNKCSAPTKFSEYINSGLRLIARDIQADFVDIFKQKKLKGILFKSNEEFENILKSDQIFEKHRNTIKLNTLSNIVETQKPYI